MADNKKYYYMRLREGFFDSDALQLMESMPDGFLYSNILLKMYLKSLKNNGRLMFNDIIPYNPQMLATITRHSVGVVEKALDIFQKLGLVEVLDNGAIYILDIQNYIGRSTTEADRKRAYRDQIESEKVLALDKCPDKSLTNIGHFSDISTPEKELDLEKEKEEYIVEQSPTTRTKNKYPYKEIIDYLNKKANRNFRATPKATQKHIGARFAEGYTLDDFKQVIDIKVAKWGNDPKMEEYLRPSTLFGTKFGEYLNEKMPANQSNGYEGGGMRNEPRSSTGTNASGLIQEALAAGVSTDFGGF